MSTAERSLPATLYTFERGLRRRIQSPRASQRNRRGEAVRRGSPKTRCSASSTQYTVRSVAGSRHWFTAIPVRRGCSPVNNTEWPGPVNVIA